MTTPRLLLIPSTYMRPAEILEALFACLAILLFVAAVYLMRHGIARCYRQARGTIRWLIMTCPEDQQQQ